MLDRISDKWVTLVLTALAGGPRRYAELGRSLPPVTCSLKLWAEAHIAEIDAARSAYDAN